MIASRTCKRLIRRRLPRVLYRGVLARPCEEGATPYVACTTAGVLLGGPSTAVIMTPSSRFVTGRTLFLRAVSATLRRTSGGSCLFALNVRPAHPRAKCKCVRVDMESTVGISNGVTCPIGAFARGPSGTVTRIFVSDNRFL